MTNLDNKPFADHTVRQTVKTTDTLLRHKSISIRNLKAMGWVGVSKGDFLDAFSEWLFTAGGRWRVLVCPLGIVSSSKCSFIRTPHKWQTQSMSLLTRAASNIWQMPYLPTGYNWSSQVEAHFRRVPFAEVVTHYRFKLHTTKKDTPPGVGVSCDQNEIGCTGNAYILHGSSVSLNSGSI
jgi:hypothetical protein